MCYTPDLTLEALNFPYIELILDEMFAVLPADMRQPSDPVYPATLQELVDQSGLTFEFVVQRLELVKRWSTDIEVFHTTESDTLLDLREDATPLQEGLPGKREAISCGQLNKQFAVWKNASRVVVLSDDNARSYSTAMFLRQKGLSATYYLKRA